MLSNIEGLSEVEWSNKMKKINIPTEFTINILNNTKQMYNSIQDYFFQEEIILIFNNVADDIAENYYTLFSAMKVESKIEAIRLIKKQIKMFKLNDKKITANIILKPLKQKKHKKNNKKIIF